VVIPELKQRALFATPSKVGVVVHTFVIEAFRLEDTIANHISCTARGTFRGLRDGLGGTLAVEAVVIAFLSVADRIADPIPNPRPFTPFAAGVAVVCVVPTDVGLTAGVAYAIIDHTRPATLCACLILGKASIPSVEPTRLLISLSVAVPIPNAITFARTQQVRIFAQAVIAIKPTRLHIARLLTHAIINSS
jgi:hypothetical protein